MKNIKYDRNKRCLDIPSFIRLEVCRQCSENCESSDRFLKLEWDIAKRIIDQVIQMGISKVIILGDEPLLYENLVDLISLFTKTHIQSEIYTSGFGLTEKLLTQMQDAGINKIHIYLNGSCARIHNLSRKYFEEAIYAIKLIKFHSMWCGVNWSARHDNLLDFENLVMLLYSMKVDTLTIFPDHHNIDEEMQSYLNDDEVEYLANLITPELKIGWINVDFCYDALRRKFTGNNLPFIYRNCLAGRLFCDVLFDGSFQPCKYKTISSDKDNLSDYWNEDEGLRKFRHENHKCCVKIIKKHNR